MRENWWNLKKDKKKKRRNVERVTEEKTNVYICKKLKRHPGRGNEFKVGSLRQRGKAKYEEFGGRGKGEEEGKTNKAVTGVNEREKKSIRQELE